MDARSRTAETSWKPAAAGVLAIIGGTFNILAAISVALYFRSTASFAVSPMATFALAAVWVGTGIVAIVGGSCAVQHRRWGLALAGAICAIFPPLITLGILSTVWVTISRGEFDP